MNAAYIVIPVLVAWIVTALFTIPVTVTLELMVCQLLRAKWTHLLPVVSGILICVPMVLWTRSLSFTSEIPVVGGMSLCWVVLAVGLLNASLGTKSDISFPKRSVIDGIPSRPGGDNFRTKIRKIIGAFFKDM